jgi:predicted helicase
VQYIVNTTHQQLIDEFKLPDGLADCMTWESFSKLHKLALPEGVNPDEPFVQILDPATGTGTFLKYTIEVIHNTMMTKWAGPNWSQLVDGNQSKFQEQWTAYVRHNLLPRLNAFELIMAPYIVCHLRLGLLLEETGFQFGAEDRLRVFLTNTLEQSTGTQLQLLGDHVAEESALADYVKNKAPISVIIGNPPYEREPNDPNTAHKGGWIRDGWGRWHNARPPLEDYLASARIAGAGAHLKNIYNLYVYFWRWSTWRVFDSLRPGIVSLITASSFLRGPGFIGLRRNWKETLSSLHIFDLEGDQKGARKTENIFNIMIPVAVSTLIRGPARSGWSGYYCRVEGTRSEKLAKCREVTAFTDCIWASIPNEGDTFVSSEAGEHRYGEWPLLTDLFPWQHSGAQFKRKWPIDFDAGTLAARWSALLNEPNRAEAYRETRDRKINSRYPHLFVDGTADQPISMLDTRSAMPTIARYAYRSFDNQWCMADNRLGDFIRPPLWRTYGIRQLYIVSLLTKVLGEGPAAVATPYVPDLDYFCNRGGKDVIPLWRNSEGTEANISNAVFNTLRNVLGPALTPEDLLAYCYAVMANPSYCRHFKNELQVPGPRIPLTKRPDVFVRAATVGRMLVQLHTYGERFLDSTDQFSLNGSAKILSAVPTMPESYPETFDYDSQTQILTVGKGRISSVSADVWNFSVSGFEVVKSWLKYRMKNGAGKKSSPLDGIRCEAWTEEMTEELLKLLWVIESTIAMYPKLEVLLDDILHHDLFTADELPKPSDPERQEPRIRQGTQLSIT